MSNLYKLLVVICLCPMALWAQDTIEFPIITDRPDATESPNTVEPGYIQIETGGYYTSFTEGLSTQEALGYNTTLVRYGLLDRVELRLGWNYEQSRNSTSELKVEGFSPMLAGVKINIAHKDGRRPEIGFLGHLYLPFSAPKSTRPQVTTSDFRFAVGHTLSERSSLAYNFGGQWAEDQAGIAYVYTIAYGYALNAKIGMYAELYGDAPELVPANHFWDAGFTYLVNGSLQYDLTVGQSITQGQNLLISAGLSYKFLK